VAADGEKALWTSWANYPKTTVSGREYAEIGDRLFSQHAVDRMQPSGLGAPAGAVGAGRNISPDIVDYVIRTGTPTYNTVNGVSRATYWSGDVGIVTESNGKFVVTVLRRSQ
jgi:filamentous hemagglutinin